jgi:hypothetical protein
MGSERPFRKERLVVGVLRSPAFARERIEEGLAGLFGIVDYRGPEFPFEWSRYYEAEMGPGLLRTFWSFAQLFDPSGLPAIKRRTDALEASWASDGKRPVNLDPGLLSLGRFSLATTKDRSHRIPLGDGIYAELTLRYESGCYRPLPWTYPDWQSPPYLAVLEELRGRLPREPS